jgi:hypothetical protein
MTDDVAAKLLAAMSCGRLAVFTGAGLSMAPPSSLLSAPHLARQIADEYRRRTGVTLPTALSSDLERLVKKLWDGGDFGFLIQSLIDWKPFRRTPNDGHFAIADRLGCDAISFAVTTNYDYLVEIAARELCEMDFMAALDGVEANEQRDHGVYLKLHGCCVRQREHTVWFREQLATDNHIKAAVAKSETWLRAALLNRDLLFVGFWSDWSYLEDVLLSVLRLVTPNRVFVVDPGELAFLETKAPKLWQWTHNAVDFEHVPESGADFLGDLRRRFCVNFVDRVFELANLPAIPNTTSLDAADELRRDACGRPHGEPLRDREPSNHMQLLARDHKVMIDHGASLEGARYLLNGRYFRLVNGAGQLLHDVRFAYEHESPAVERADVIVCSGADDDGGGPAYLTHTAISSTTLRPRSMSTRVTSGGLKAEIGPPV